MRPCGAFRGPLTRHRLRAAVRGSIRRQRFVSLFPTATVRVLHSNFPKVPDLARREGKSFPLREKPIRLEDGATVIALVPVYEGRQLILGKSLGEIAAMAIAAQGIRGTGVQYVRDVAAHLASAGVNDAVVTALLREIDTLSADVS